MHATTQARWGAAVTVFAPAAFLAAMAYHPQIPDLQDNANVVATLAADTTRWWIAHLLIGIAGGFLALAFLAVRSHLRRAGEERWSALAVPFVVVASTLFAMLPAMELGMLAAHEAGSDAIAAQNATDTWFVPILLTSSILFAVGALAFAAGVVKSRVLSPWLTWLVVGALVVTAATRFVPTTTALVVGGAASVVALWPLAYAMWTGTGTQAAERTRTAAAT